MNDVEYKLKHLQACIGEKKLKQLGLITCSTCREILTQVMNISLPLDLENKVFLTSEEMSTISQSILEATNGSLINTLSHNDISKTTDTVSIFLDSNEVINNEENNSPNQLLDHEENDSTYQSLDNEADENIYQAFDSEDNNNTYQVLDTEESDNTYQTFDSAENNSRNSEIKSLLLEELNNTSIHNQQELMSKLLSILGQSQHVNHDNLGMGYIYTPPHTIQLEHALSCSECGHQYMIITHPNLKLVPLPVYLTDTEYEMIKGIYVDILL